MTMLLFSLGGIIVTCLQTLPGSGSKHQKSGADRSGPDQAAAADDPGQADAGQTGASLAHPFAGWANGVTESEQAFETAFTTASDAMDQSQLVRAVFENTLVSKCLLTPDGKLFAVNGAMCDYLGYTPEAMSHQTLSSLTHPEDRELMADQQRQLSAGLIDAYQFEKRFLHRDGSTRWALVCITALYQSDGAFHGCVAEIQDLNPQKSAEAAFLAEHRRLKLAGSLAQMGTFEIDLAMGSTIWSEEVRQQIGIELGGFDINYEIGMLNVHDEDRARAREAIQTAIELRQEFRIELRIRHASGEYHHHLSHGRVLTDDLGEPVKVMGYLLNLTPFRQRELELLEANRQLELQNQALHRLTGLVADELTDTLTGMQVTAGREADRGQTSGMLPFLATTLRGLELLDEASERLRQTRRLEPERRRIDIAPVFSRVLEMLETGIQRSQARISADFSAWTELEFIPGYLENLLFNLLGHVLELSRQSPPAEIRVSSEHDNNSGQILQVLLRASEAPAEAQALLSLPALQPEAYDRLALVSSLLAGNGSKLSSETGSDGLSFRILF